MKTSDASWSHSLRLIGDLERADHWHLRDEDQCYFFGEFTAYAGWSHSDTNQRISNLKKKPSTRGTAQWPHKQAAIAHLGRSIAASIKPAALPGITFIPIPPSKPEGHPEYDDRMAQVSRHIGATRDARDVLYTRVAREARHLSDGKRDPVALKESLGVRRELLTANPPTTIALLDDVLTTGCSFTVCKDLVLEVVPQARVIGIFAARRVIDRSAEFDDLDFDDL